MTCDHKMLKKVYLLILRRVLTTHSLIHSFQHIIYDLVKCMWVPLNHVGLIPKVVRPTTKIVEPTNISLNHRECSGRMGGVCRYHYSIIIFLSVTLILFNQLPLVLFFFLVKPSCSFSFRIIYNVFFVNGTSIKKAKAQRGNKQRPKPGKTAYTGSRELISVCLGRLVSL